MRNMVVVLLLAGLAGAGGAAQPVADPARQAVEVQKRIRELEQRFELRAPPSAEPTLEAHIAEVLGEERRAAQRRPFLSALRFFESFRPQISATFDFLGHYSDGEGGELDEGVFLRELEFGFSARLGLFARFDAFVGIHKAHAHEHIHAHDHGHHEEDDHHGHEHEHHEEDDHGDGHGYDIHLEEAYVTFLTLPWNLTARAGKFRVGFGWANTQHPHSLPWVDYPLAVKNFLGHEGLFGVGGEVSWLAPWDRPYTELTYEAFRNESESVFGQEGCDGLVHLVHLRNFFELSPSSTLEVGLSAATGGGSSRTNMEGIDLTYKWRPVGRGLYRSLAWRTELLASQKRGRNAWGSYSGPEYQFARRWSVGVRYDYSELPDCDDLHESAFSAYLTFKQSERVFWRLGVMHSARNFERHGEKDETQVFLQLDISLGTHRPHRY